MPSATKLPTLTEMVITQLSRADFDLPSLQNALNATDVTSTIKFNGVLKKSDGTTFTGGMLVGIESDDGYIETVWLPAGSSADGQTFTSCVRGIDRGGIDYTVGDSTQVIAHRSGARVFCSVSALVENLVRSAIQGTIATGGSNFIIGTDADGTVTVSRSTGTGTYVGWIRWSTTNDKVEFSNDGSIWNTFDSVTASNLVVVSSNDTTPSNLNAKITTTDGRITKTILNPAGNETLDLTLGTTSTNAELNKLTGTSANVTPTNLNTLTGGSNADALHTHSVSTISVTAGEAINGSTTPQAVAILGNNYRRGLIINANGVNVFDIAAGTARNMGDADATTRWSQSFAYTDALATTIKLETWTLLIDKVLAPADNIYIEIQTDSSGSPSGTVVTNGTSDVIAGGTISTVGLPTKFSWSTPPTLTSGTTYWAVLRRSGANDGANYFRVWDAGASTYASHTAKSYTASTQLWADLSRDLQAVAQFICDYDGKAVLADADNMLRAKFSGFTTSNVSAGSSINVSVDGYQGSFTGLSESAPEFVDTTAGSITTSPSISTTFGSATALIKAGEASKSTTVKINPSFEHIVSGITGISGSNLIETGAGTATLDLLIETGFSPQDFEIRYTLLNVAASATDDRYYITRFVRTTQVGPVFRIISPALTLNGATSTIDATAMTQVAINAIYENGYLLRITLADNAEVLGNLLIRATA